MSKSISGMVRVEVGTSRLIRGVAQPVPLRETTGRALGPQMRVGGARPEILRLVPAYHDPSWEHMNKPGAGLWTSSLVDGFSDWVRWSREQRYGDPDHETWWKLVPRYDARLLEFDTVEDLESALAVFGEVTERYRDRGVFDSPVLRYDTIIAAGYDGVHLTENGSRVLHWGTLSSPIAFNAWDVESTVWFHWAFAKVRRLRGPQERKP